MSKTETKKYSPNKIFSRIKRLIAYAPKYVLIAFMGAVLSAVTRFGLQYFSGLLTSTATQHAMDKEPVWGSLFMIAMGLILVSLPNLPGFYYNAYGSYKFGGRIKHDMISRYLRKTEKDALDEHSGNFMNRLTADCTAVEFFFGQSSSFGIIAPIITGIAGIITVWAVNYRFVILLLVIGMVSAIVSLLFSKSTYKWAKQGTEASGRNTEMLSSVLSGTLQIKNLGIQSQMLSDISERIDEMNHRMGHLQNLQNIVQFFKQFFEMIGMVACLALAASLSERGIIQFSSVMLVISMQSMISNMLAAFGEIWNKLISLDAHVERIFEALDTETEKDRKELPDLVPIEDASALVYENVSFSYTDERQVLKDVSLEIPRGSRVGITGSSGGGKSTILGLALNYFEPDTGEIRLLGVRAKDCSLGSWRRQAALVQQNSPMMDLSIGENIALGKLADLRPTQTEIEEAAKAAGAHDFIMDLPNGYDTLAGEHGGTLSGGQRQRIAIARALLSGAPLILLDEPTSALDSDNERLVTETLENISKDRTVIVITHRLNTIKNFDEILVLDKGCVVEKGRHEELIKQSKVYACLWNISNTQVT